MNAIAAATVSDPTRASLHELLVLRRSVPRNLPSPPTSANAADVGGHASSVRGRGMDYRESRVYQPGDDVRRLDWRLTARSGRLHTKVFQEERDLSLMLLLDLHPSMRFGTRRRFKSVQALRAAAMAAWWGVAAGMRIGAAGIGAGRHVLRPRAGERGALAALRALVAWQDDAATAAAAEPLSAALQRVARVARGGQRLLLIGDGGCLDAEARAQLLQLRRRLDIGVLVVADALETEPPPAGTYPLAWAGRARRVDLRGDAQRRAFRDALGGAPGRLQHLARELALPHARIDTVDDPMTVLPALLGSVAGRRR